MRYLESLQLLKSSLMGGTEIDIIAKLINEHFENREYLSWLDVGVGDGYSLKKILTELGSRYKINITGIDPVLTESTSAKEIFPLAAFIPIAFEKFVTDAQFEVGPGPAPFNDGDLD